MNIFLGPFGTVTTPVTGFDDIESGGLGQLINVLVNLLIVIAGIYALFNFILAGYAFMSAGGDSKKIEAAWAKIWQTVLGLAFTAGAFVLAAIFGELIFGDSTFILSPILPTLN